MTKPPSAAQRAARQAFVDKWRPDTDLDGLGPEFVEPELVGRQLYHRQLGIVLAYRWSARSLIYGGVVRGGQVVRVAPGVGIAVGSEWGTWADRLRIVIPKENASG